MKAIQGLYRLRFEVLLRDAFTCQYCGRKAADVVLEIDHRIAKTDGGGNSLENLITTCQACNRGKGSISVMLGEPLSLYGKRRLREGAIDRIFSVLSALGEATATEIAPKAKVPRAEVSRLLNLNPDSRFRRLGRVNGGRRGTYYGVTMASGRTP